MTQKEEDEMPLTRKIIWRFYDRRNDSDVAWNNRKQDIAARLRILITSSLQHYTSFLFQTSFILKWFSFGNKITKSWDIIMHSVTSLDWKHLCKMFIYIPILPYIFFRAYYNILIYCQECIRNIDCLNDTWKLYW